MIALMEFMGKLILYYGLGSGNVVVVGHSPFAAPNGILVSKSILTVLVPQVLSISH